MLFKFTRSHLHSITLYRAHKKQKTNNNKKPQRNTYTVTAYFSVGGPQKKSCFPTVSRSKMLNSLHNITCKDCVNPNWLKETSSITNCETISSLPNQNAQKVDKRILLLIGHYCAIHIFRTDPFLTQLLDSQTVLWQANQANTDQKN